MGRLLPTHTAPASPTSTPSARAPAHTTTTSASPTARATRATTSVETPCSVDSRCPLLATRAAAAATATEQLLPTADLFVWFTAVTSPAQRSRRAQFVSSEGEPARRETFL